MADAMIKAAVLIGAECSRGVHDTPPGCAGKHCHEKYVWTPVCFTTSPHHGLVQSYRTARTPALLWTIVRTGANVQFVSSKLDVFASFFALHGLEGVSSVCDRCTTSPLVRCVVRRC